MAGIEVFQDLTVSGSADRMASLAAELQSAAAPPWSFDAEESATGARNALGAEGILIFERQPHGELPGARLVLWPQGGEYHVPNITPTETSELTVGEYDAVLSEFAESVLAPTARRIGVMVATTAASQGLEDWLDADAAQALRRFSGAANKSTGASHPMDQQRWFDFIIAAHRSGRRLGTDHLTRWLAEAEGWDEDSAYRLAGEFERATSLLEREAETR